MSTKKSPGPDGLVWGYHPQRLEAVTDLVHTGVQEIHQPLLDAKHPHLSRAVYQLDHLTGWRDARTGAVAVVTQSYSAPTDTERAALALRGLALIPVPEGVAPYRTSPGRPKTHPFLICRSDQAYHFARVLRGLY